MNLTPVQQCDPRWTFEMILDYSVNNDMCIEVGIYLRPLDLEGITS